MKKLLSLILLCVLPISGCGKSSDEKAAIKLVHDYYSFVASYSDMPNAEYDAGTKFNHPETDYMGPGGDDETYEIVDKDYEIVKVETKKENNNPKSNYVEVTVRFKKYGYLDLFKEGFSKDIGFDDVTFDCSKSKGKYLVWDLSDVHIRFYENAVTYLKEKLNEPLYLANHDRLISELKGLQRAVGKT